MVPYSQFLFDIYICAEISLEIILTATMKYG
jgi:hypothetical protein